MQQGFLNCPKNSDVHSRIVEVNCPMIRFPLESQHAKISKYFYDLVDTFHVKAEIEVACFLGQTFLFYNLHLA